MLFKWNKDMNWPISIFQTSDKLVQLSLFVGGVGVFVVVDVFFLTGAEPLLEQHHISPVTFLLLAYWMCAVPT